MRLLHFDEFRRLVLTDFTGKTTPPYAILSHRWCDSEILIEDIANEAYKHREDGYQKLQFCAKQAALDGLQYFWIDTCCIDKWNLQELSKSINSMFQWYKDAAQCYVFMPDVSTETPQCNDWEASFRASVWFTRGWTLQELIAPASVEFFSREGQRIGDRKSLDQLIHDITNIPLAALRNCPLEDFTISERMRWVENRTTKEEEDIVYCLLGILGVSMPIVYGEGRESAERKLQAELYATGSAPSIIPFSRNPRFVGRESQLAEVEAKLFSNEQSTTTLAITGTGGTGKSQLALEVAHRTVQNNWGCSVFWIDASDKDRLHQSFASIAQKLGVAGWDDDQADMEQLIQRCVVEMSARECLLIFDNAEDTTLQSVGSSNSGTANLADCLPQSKLCSAIFTTTNSDTAHALASQNIVTLQELTPDMALKMLTDRLARPLSTTELQEAEHLVKELLHLPLAVVQAAACMNARSMMVQDYRSQLDRHKALAMECSSDSHESQLRSSSGKDPVATTLSLSIDQIRHDNTLAADYLFIAACVDRKDISLELLEAASPYVREDAVKLLDKYALITRRPADSALDVHRLVHQALREQSEVEGTIGQWTLRAITQLRRVFPNDNHRNRSKWRRLLPHAQYALSHSRIADGGTERWFLANSCAIALFNDGRYTEAEELTLQVVETAKKVVGDEHVDTLINLANLASIYRSQGRWKEAEEVIMQVTEARKRVLGEEHPETLSSIASLASTYWAQGRWKEAEELDVQVMQTRKRVLGDEHPQTVVSVANLASAYWGQGRWPEAEELQVQVVQTAKKVLGDENPQTLISLSNLAWIYRSQERWKESEELEEQVIQARKKILGDEHPDTLVSMQNLACTLHSQSRHKEAVALLEKCIELQQRVLGEQHPHTQASLKALNVWRA